MRRNLSYALLLVALLTFILWIVSQYIQPILPKFINASGILFFAVLLAVLGGLAGLKDTIELVQMFQNRRNQSTLTETPTHHQETAREESNLNTTIFDQLPSRAYRRLLGRDVLIAEALSALRDPTGKTIVAIDGMGGIGKTALARELANIALEHKLFDQVVWEQASKEHVITKSILNKASDFDELLDAIARKIGTLDVVQLQGMEKYERLKNVLAKRNVLIVLDNLETASINQSEIVERFHNLLGRSKAIFTSRARFHSLVFGIHLTGLDDTSAIQLVRDEAEQKNIKKVVSAREDELSEIVHSTGGSPLAIKLIIGQLGYLPVKHVLTRLQKIQASANILNEDEYVQFYKGIFLPSWELLSDEAKNLLVSMTSFVPGVGGRIEAIGEVSGIDEEQLPVLVDELWKLSLIEVGDSPSLHKVRYYIHALTQYFVLSDIVKIIN